MASSLLCASTHEPLGSSLNSLPLGLAQVVRWGRRLSLPQGRP